MISLFIEFDVTKQAASHEEDQRGIKQDQTSLDDVTIVWKVGRPQQRLAMEPGVDSRARMNWGGQMSKFGERT